MFFARRVSSISKGSGTCNAISGARFLAPRVTGSPHRKSCSLSAAQKLPAHHVWSLGVRRSDRFLVCDASYIYIVVLVQPFLLSKPSYSSHQHKTGSLVSLGLICQGEGCYTGTWDSVARAIPLVDRIEWLI